MDNHKIVWVNVRGQHHLRARAVIRERREVVRVDAREVAHYNPVPLVRRRPKPCRVARCARVDGVVHEVRERTRCKVLCCWGGDVRRGLLRGGAVRELRVLHHKRDVRRPRESERDTHECRSVRRGGRTEGEDGVVVGDVVEEVGCADGVRAVAGAGKVAGRGHYRPS